MNIKQKKTYLMLKGEKYHEYKNMLDVKYKSYDIIIKDRYFKYKDMAAKIDMIKIKGNELTVVEFKRFLKAGISVRESHIFQCVIGGIVSSYNLNKEFKHIEICGFNGITNFVQVNKHLIDKSRVLVDEIKNMIKNKILPNPTDNESKCNGCEYWRRCYRI